MVDSVQYDSTARDWPTPTSVWTISYGRPTSTGPVDEAHLEVDEQPDGRTTDREVRTGLMGEHTEHLGRHDRRTPRRVAVRAVPGRPLGDPFELVGEREGIQRTVRRVEVHRDGHRLGGHADLELVDDVQFTRVAEATFATGVELGRGVRDRSMPCPSAPGCRRA